MSHVTEVKLKLTDLDAVEEAAKACGLELVRGQRSFRWYGHFVGDTTPPAGRDPKDYGKCEHALRQTALPDGYEIGLVPALDGNGWDAMYDSWSSAGRALPAAVTTLRREYAATVATKRATATLARRGFKISREDLPGNRIRLKLRSR